MYFIFNIENTYSEVIQEKSNTKKPTHKEVHITGAFVYSFIYLFIFCLSVANAKTFIWV